MLLREFRIGDEAALHKVFLSAIHQIAVRDYTAEQINAWAPTDLNQDVWRQRMRDIKPFIVELHGEVIAYADVQSDGYIDHFFVSGAFPRQGVGRLLMDRIHCAAADLKLNELTSDVSRTAQPFFKHFGFQIVEDRSPVIRGVVVPNALMRKELHCPDISPDRPET